MTMRSNAVLLVQPPIAAGLGAAFVACAPLCGAVGLFFASPANGTPAMCAVDPAAYGSSEVCQLPSTEAKQAVITATQSGHSSLLQANRIDQAGAGNPNTLPEVNGIPYTGLNTGKCIGLQFATPTGG